MSLRPRFELLCKSLYRLSIPVCLRPGEKRGYPNITAISVNSSDEI